MDHLAVGLRDEILGHNDQKLGFPWLGICFLDTSSQEGLCFSPCGCGEDSNRRLTAKALLQEVQLFLTGLPGVAGGRLKPWL